MSRQAHHAKTISGGLALVVVCAVFDLGIVYSACAQQFRPQAPGTVQSTAVPPGGRPSYPVLPQDEDWRFFEGESTRGPYDDLKQIRLTDNGQVALTFGLRSRLVYEFYEGENFGRNPGADGSIHLRLNPSVALEVGSRFRAYAALKHASVNGRRFPFPASDEDALDLHQGFVELGIGDLAGAGIDDVLLRAGRQELHYGAGRIISVREGPNVRDDFDGVLIRARHDGWVADALAFHAVEDGRGVFDNGTNDQESILGAYSSGPVISGVNADLYVLRQLRRDAVSNEGSFDETRDTIGGRLWSAPGGIWSWDLEIAYQSGELASAATDVSVSAYFVAGRMTRSLAGLPWDPRLGLLFEVASGDERAGDGKLETFRPAYPSGSYFGETVSLGPGNTELFKLYLTLAPAEKITVEPNVLVFRRIEDADGVYNRPGALLLGSGGTRNDVGWEIGSALTYQASRRLSFYVYGGHLFAGGYLDDNTTGEDTTYVAAAIAFRF